MTEFALIKLPGGLLRPANEVDFEKINKMKNGQYLTADVKQVRNPQFLAKFMKLMSVAYGYWEPEEQELGGIKSVKSFNKFRYDVVCMAGFGKVVVGLDGKATLEAESVSFAKMDETKFQEVYKAVFNVLWENVFQWVQGFTESEVENTVNELLSFDG